VTLSMRNDSVIWHNIAIRGNGIDVLGPLVGAGGVSTVTANLAAGTYEFYCSVPGHAEAGMKGTLIVGDGGGAAPPPTTPTTPSTPPPSSAQLVASGLGFNYSSLSATAGTVTINMFNDSVIPHNVAIRGNGVDVQGPVVGKGQTSSVTAELAPGTYEFYCSVPGHAEAGMKGTLVVTEPGTKAPASVPTPTTTTTTPDTPTEGHDHETASAPKTPPTLVLSCATGLNFTLTGNLVAVSGEATSVALRVKGATAKTAKARKQARRYVGKQLRVLLYAKTGLKRDGKPATVEDLKAGDKVSVNVRLCKVDRRGALRPIAAVVTAHGKPAPGGGPAPDGAIQLTATGVKFDKTHLEAKAGKVTITLKNNSPLEHNVAIRGNGVQELGPVVKKGGISTVTATLAPGQYEFYCSVPGHEQGGMKGMLMVTP
jgi:plastocyanin